ncbi:CtsR family transcriptional regulator [Listeria monocytogenes]|jgi:Transcriptional repressor of class III stress genes|uniref:Transcriptional regulator CtsR n=15 Tax=Listeria TaxID=1637 RepID=Q7AP89_LISMO|nr:MULTISPECIES: CtsR family transcriptional regulator [Listeria]NP_463760.1 CtsR family transcriptional regulator [Listeria monocytogenes EGD-e]EAA0164143.1 CtsR family transcriptional regulator [Listeria monocytogenes serotype 1/2a]EAD3236074.1 CtsR family transcriptional regulator [Listeria monocytogenes CFSAN002202]EAE3703579.1 CtsR family transcriptional regulator [Listeria monocytogenes serotype 1/2c]EAE6023061.1 CtsR family transcriptional regulator [Listeria monocytogenes serotype 3a]
MKNISDIIEAYLKQVLESSEAVEIKRSEIADKFECVPSQINYVINTRFTMERGYIVESKRGGGGYIRIIKVKMNDKLQLLEAIISMVHDKKVSQSFSEDVILRLLEEEVITKKEARLMVAALDREVLILPLPDRDILRSRILEAMLVALKYD